MAEMRIWKAAELTDSCDVPLEQPGYPAELSSAGCERFPCTFPPHSFFSLHLLPLELQLTGKTTQLPPSSPKGLQTPRFPCFVANPEAVPKPHQSFPQLWNLRTELSVPLPFSLQSWVEEFLGYVALGINVPNCQANL